MPTPLLSDMTRKSVFGPTYCSSFGACPTPGAPARRRACARMPPPPRWPRLAPHHSSLFQVRGVGGGVGALWRMGCGGHGRTGARTRPLRKSSAACRPPPFLLPRATCTAASTARPTPLTTTLSFDVLAATPCPVARARRPCARLEAECLLSVGRLRVRVLPPSPPASRVVDRPSPRSTYPSTRV